jgi:hypothetical protein
LKFSKKKEIATESMMPAHEERVKKPLGPQCLDKTNESAVIIIGMKHCYLITPNSSYFCGVHSATCDTIVSGNTPFHAHKG